MSTPLPNPKALYSFDDLLEIEERTGTKYELFDGRIEAMTGGTKAHNLIALGLFTEIDRQREHHCRLYVADVKLRINHGEDENARDTSTYPDVMLACGEENSDLYEENPLLIAEVLSDGTARKDKGKKKDEYLSLSSLHAYLVLSQTEIMMTVHQRHDGGWTSHVFLGRDTEVPLQLGPEHKPIILNLARIYRYVEDRI